jgi:hypothetical protein
MHRGHRINMAAFAAADFSAGILIAKSITLAAFFTIYVYHYRFSLSQRVSKLLLLLPDLPFFYFLYTI